MSKNLIGQTLLNQYRVDAFLAAGGMGAVYQVWDQKRSVLLAMKVLRADLAEDPSIIKRFRREANALKKLTHPNIVPFYGLFQAEALNFLLEAYIDGPTLKEIIKKNGAPFSVNDALVYLKALSAALGYAHAHGVVHCDVKPGNVMIDKGGNIYLTDFGIARHAESTTTTLPTVGTAAYMAPEQIRGDAVTPATDVYALGVIVYEMLAGRRPFQGEGNDTGGGSTGATAAERIRYGHLNLDPPDPRNYNPGINEALARIMLRALAKNPTDRFQNVREFYEAILAISGQTHSSISDRVPMAASTIASIGYAAFPTASGAAGKETIKGNLQRIPVWVWGIVGVILLALLFFGWNGLRSGASPTPVVVLVTATAQVSSTPVPSETPVPSITPTATQTFTPLPTNTPTLSPTPTIAPVYEWLPEILQPSLAAGAFSSMAIDDQGYMHVAFFQDTGDIIWYAHNNTRNKEWAFENLHGEAGWGFHISLALDNQGNPYIAFNNVPSKKRLPFLWYVFWTSNGWSQNFRNGNKNVTNTDISLAMGLDNVPHFAYQWDQDNSLMYSRFTQSQGWVDQKVDDSSDGCLAFPIALDPNGDPHMSYCASEGGLKYARLEGDSWRRQVVDPSGGAGVYSDLVIDANGQPHIAYYDQGTGALKYATLVGENWEIQVIDDQGDVGQYPSIAVDLEGHIHISYYDVSNTALKYAYGNLEGWYQEEVDNKGEVGEFSSIALMPSSGEPRISYYDRRNEDLKLAVATRR